MVVKSALPRFARLSNAGSITDIICGSLPAATAAISSQQRQRHANDRIETGNGDDNNITATKTAFHSLGALLQWGQRLDGVSRSKIAVPLAKALAGKRAPAGQQGSKAAIRSSWR